MLKSTQELLALREELDLLREENESLRHCNSHAGLREAYQSAAREVETLTAKNDAMHLDRKKLREALRYFCVTHARYGIGKMHCLMCGNEWYGEREEHEAHCLADDGRGHHHQRHNPVPGSAILRRVIGSSAR